MSEFHFIDQGIANIPWQDKPETITGAPVWRYSANPIIGRNPVDGVARIFNSAVIPYEGAFIGVFRGEQVNGIPYIYLGRSEDGINWKSTTSFGARIFTGPASAWQRQRIFKSLSG